MNGNSFVAETYQMAEIPPPGKEDDGDSSSDSGDDDDDGGDGGNDDPNMDFDGGELSWDSGIDNLGL
jgi:hypothetical protein